MNFLKNNQNTGVGGHNMNNMNNEMKMEKMYQEYDELMTKKTMYSAVMENGKKENCISDRNEQNVNLNNNDTKMFNNVLGGDNEKKSPANLADITIFDNEGNLNLREMQMPLIFLYVGKCASGKSVAIKNLIYNYSKLNYFKFILAIIPSKFNNDYTYLPDKYVIENYDEKYLQNYFNKLRQFKQKNGFIPANALIIDDSLGAVNFYSGFWSHLFSCYRHYKTTIIFGTQALSGKGGISTLLRQVCNIACCYRNVYNDNIEGLYKAFGSVMDNYDEFKEAFLNVTSQKYHSLMFCNDKNSKEESYYDYISDLAPNFKLNY